MSDAQVVHKSGRRSTFNFHRRGTQASSLGSQSGKGGGSVVGPLRRSYAKHVSASSPFSSISGANHNRRSPHPPPFIKSAPRTPAPPPTPPNHVCSSIYPKATGRTYYYGIYNPIDRVGELQKYFCHEELAKGFRRPKAM